MDRQEIISELKSSIGNYLKMQNLDLVDLIYRYEGKDVFLRFLVDRPEGGISLGECARLNNEISIILDEKDILKVRYILEISSPGMDRSLVTKSDFLRCINKRVKFFLNESISGRVELEGTVIQVGEASVYIDIDGEPLEIPFLKVAKAKQIINIE